MRSALDEPQGRRSTYVLPIIILIGTFLFHLAFYWDWFAVPFQALAGPSDAQAAYPVTFGIGELALVLAVLLLGAFVGTGLAAVINLKVQNGGWILSKTLALILGLGIIGLVATFLTMFQVLTQASVLGSLVGLAVVAVAAIVVVSKQGLKGAMQAMSRVWRFPAPQLVKMHVPIIGMIAVIEFFIFYHALFTPIDHFDALIYHSAMSKIFFNNDGMPLIYGTSPGIEMSANYPPLYPVFGALLFALSGDTNDALLKLMNPVFSLITIAITYKLGNELGAFKQGAGNVGIIAVALMVATPLFMLYSVFTLNYMVQLVFVTASLLLFVVYLKHRYEKSRNAILALVGLTSGLALLTNYTSIYFLIPVFLTLAVLTFKRYVRIQHLAVFAALLVIGGGFWLVRNWVVLGNPIYPWYYSVFGGIGLDEEMIDAATASVKETALYVSLGENPTAFDWLQFILLNRATFPALSLLTIAGIAAVLISFRHEIRDFVSRRSKDLTSDSLEKGFLIFWMLAMVGMIFISGVFFPRYFVIVLSVAAVFAALPISHAFERKKALVGIILVLMLFHPGLTAALSGKLYHDVAAWPVPQSDEYLFYLQNPGIDHVQSMLRGEGERILTWEWLNENLQEGEKVATWESRIYYIKNATLDYFFLLDGKDAKPLYEIENEAEILNFLQNNNVKYILVMDIISVGRDKLPLMNYLGSDNFPLVYARSDGAIYGVGEAAQFYYDTSTFGWQKNADGTLTMEANSTYPRIVTTAKDAPTKLSFEYFDEGTSNVDINYKLPEPNKWMTYSIISRTDSQTWKTYAAFLPQNIPGIKHHELGLNSGESFEIRNLKVEVSEDTNTPSIAIAGTPILNTFYGVEVGDSSSRLLINAPHDGTYKVDLIYRDLGAGNVDFNVQQKDGTWQGLDVLYRTDERVIKTHTFYVDGEAGSIITIGVSAHENTFLFVGANVSVSE